MKQRLIVLLAIAVAIAACKNKSSNSFQKAKITEIALPAPVAMADKEISTQKFEPPAVETENIEEPVGNAILKQIVIQKPATIEKKIIKEGDIRFETGNVIDARRQIINSLKHLGGYAEDDSETTDGALGSKEYTLNIRIPAKNFDAFLGAVSSTATKIDSRNIRIKDVTTQYIDTKTRLDNKLQLEKRYLSLLNRAGKMRDLLDIEEKLTEIRSDIEATQGQLNYMSKQVEYSSLAITFYTRQPEQVAAGNGFGYKLKNALISGWDTLQSLFFSLISSWPILLIIAVPIVLIRRWKSNKAVKAA
jgi:hypothetical protein